jgi:two-component system, chemotaxis family, chemotaxis protein CheY
MPDDVRQDTSASEALPSGGTSGTVLVIDDDAAVRDSLVTLLEVAGYRVQTASGGVEGVAAYRACQPDVVLTDMIMSGKAGLAVTMEIRREWPHAKIIAMSGGGRIGNRDFLEIASMLGADVTLAKPFDTDQLLSALRHAIEAQPYQRATAAA